VNVSSIWREARAAFEGIDHYRSRPQLDPDVVPGDGRPVLLVPGYLAGDRSLGPLAGWLREIGYAPEHAAISVNVDCATRTTDRLVQRLRTIAAAHDDRVAIVGHSLGGVLGRLLATREPDLVRGVVCLGSPLLNLDAVNPLVWANVRLMGALGDLGVPGVLSRGCLGGACCAESRRLVRSPFPSKVGFVSVYSRSDGIVDWRSCLDPDAEHIEVQSTHIGMAMNPVVCRVLAERLAVLGDERAPQPLSLAA
jgi:pimeloyl-ACP methyl ester carboxylesterase